MTQGRMSLFVGLTSVAAAVVICGLTLVSIGLARHMQSAHGGYGLVSLGAVIACCGLAFGVALLAVLAADLGDRGGVPAAGAAGPARQIGPLTRRETALPVPPPQPADAAGEHGYAGDIWSPGPEYAWVPADAGGGDRESVAGDGWALDGRAEWDPASPEGWGDGASLWASAEPAPKTSVWEPGPKRPPAET